MREGALPSPVEPGTRTAAGHRPIAKRDNYRINVIEAFDQPWKRYFEGTVGGYWGVLDGKTRDSQIRLGFAGLQPSVLAAASGLGVVLAVPESSAAFSVASPAAVKGGFSTWMWAGLSLIAASAGILSGWTIENVPFWKSLSYGDIVRSVLYVAIASVLPRLCALMLAARPAAAGAWPAPSDAPANGLPTGCHGWSGRA